MAELHLVTGYKGSAHVTAEDQAFFNAVTVGADSYIFTKGKRFEAQIISNNIVRILDGALLMSGRYVRLETGSYIDVTIPNGTSGMKRNDVIMLCYSKDTTTGVESVHLEVFTGTATSGTPTDPTISSSDGMPLYRVVLNGVTLEAVEPLYQVLAPMAEFQHGFYKQNMLINGDFNCNQRGNKAYDRASAVGYTLDMWRGFGVKVDVLNEGIKLTGTNASGVGYFTQFIQLGVLKTTTYTISAMADDEVCTFTVTPGGTSKEKNFGKFKISASTTSTWDNDLNGYNNKLKVNICPIGTNSVTIKYVDVFEGTVAYPHVVEDPATALMRCRRYIQRNGITTTPIARVNDNDESYPTKYRLDLFFDEMPTIPRLTKCQWYYISTKGELEGDTDNTEVIDISKYFLRINTKSALGFGDTDGCLGVRVHYIVSCEHNQLGD